VDMQAQSIRCGKSGAVVVHISVPCEPDVADAGECDRASVKRIKSVHQSDDLSDSDEPPGMLQRAWRFVTGAE